jgi:hypothetical protein
MDRLRPPRAASILATVDRRRVGACAALVVGMLGLTVPACGLSLSGLDNVDASVMVDATVDAPPDSANDVGTDGDAAGIDGSAMDARVDGPGVDAEAGGVPDASPDADACGTVEICDNGIDDNCNGLVDCADPQCQSEGWVCTPAVPSGWSLVAYVAGSRPDCAMGWGSLAPLVEGPDAGAATCVCSCGQALGTPSCVVGTASLSLGGSACGCAQVQEVPLLSSGGCDPIGASIGQPCGPWDSGLVQPVGLDAGPPSAPCVDDPQRPAITYAAQGETCVAQGNTGGGCNSGGGCLPAPAPATACIEAAGIQTCPIGFLQQHVAYAPSNVIDERQCGPCGCATTPTCTGASVTLFDDSACTKFAAFLPADGNCDPLSGNPTGAGWFRYAATTTPNACTGAATTGLDGGLLLRAPATICCP